MDYNVFFYRLTNLKSFENISSILDIAVFQEPLKNGLSHIKKFVMNKRQLLRVDLKL